jgi:hypothetical protein
VRGVAECREQLTRRTIESLIVRDPTSPCSECATASLVAQQRLDAAGELV